MVSEHSRIWLHHIGLQLEGGREDRCEFGHQRHERLNFVAEIPGTRHFLNLTAMNWFHHSTPDPGYCTGRCEVSKGLQHALCWERNESILVLDALMHKREGDVVVDCGSHLGWYTLLAMYMGYDVLAIDADPEHLEVLKANVIANFPNQDRVKRPVLCRGWIDENSLSADADPDVRIRLLKLDIEGQELAGLRVFEDCFEQGLVDNVLLEVTPPNLPDSGDDIRGGNLEAVELLMSHGFTGYRADTGATTTEELRAGSPDEWPGDGQRNVLFVK